MIEMLGVLAIIGVLSVEGIAGYSKAMMKYRVNKTIDQITTIAANIQTLYGNQQDYQNLSLSILEKAKVIPEEMKRNNGYFFAIGVSWNTAYLAIAQDGTTKAFMI